MNEATRASAVQAGAKTEEDFALFATLTTRRDQYREMHTSEPSESVRDMLALYEHYLERGRFFEPRRLPKGFRRGEAHQCYGNSFDLAMSKEGLTYCEGYVLFSLGSGAAEVEHAWCVTVEGKVIDVTLKQVGVSYFGIAYTPEELGGNPDLPFTDDIILAKLRGADLDRGAEAPPAPRDTRAAIDALLPFLPTLESDRFRAGEWHVEEGVMPFFSPAEEVGRFVDALYEYGWVVSFDWPAWRDEAERYVGSPESVAGADLNTIRKLFTTHVRQDRFCEGHLSEMIRTGHVAALLRRLRELRELAP